MRTDVSRKSRRMRGEWCFPSRRSETGHVVNVRKLHQRACRNAELKFRLYDLRHTYASLARASGADLRYVQKTMGHSTPTVTANIYSDLYSDELDHVATNLDRLHDVANSKANGQEPDNTNRQ